MSDVVSEEDQRLADESALQLQTLSQTGCLADQIADRRKAAIEASVQECLVRAGGAAMNVIKRAHVLVAALRNRGIDNYEMLERSEHLPERLNGSRLAVESIIEEIGLCAIVEKHAGEIDQEQLVFDARNKVRQVLRELI